MLPIFHPIVSLNQQRLLVTGWSLFILICAAGGKDTWMTFTVAVTNRNDSSPKRKAVMKAALTIYGHVSKLQCDFDTENTRSDASYCASDNIG